MSILDRFKAFWKQHGDVKSREPIWMCRLARDYINDPELKQRSDVDILPGVHYVQLTARRMNLRTDEFIGRERFPVVHSQVVVDTGSNRMVFPSVAGHDTIGELDLAATGRISGASYPLSPLIPYHDGQIEMVAGVVSMKGEDTIGRLTRVVNRVTSLMPVAGGIATAVETATGIMKTAIDCVEDLFGLPDTTIVLGMHDLFAAHVGKLPKTGLYAILNPRSADPNKANGVISDPRLLRFEKDELIYADEKAGPRALRDHDWLVIEFGALTHRAYTSFPPLVEAYNKAISDLANDPQKAVSELNAALTMAGMSTQIVRADRSAVFAELREDFDEIAKATKVNLVPASGRRKRKSEEGGLLAGGEKDFTDFLVRVA